jgi:hypothetical protein
MNETVRVTETWGYNVGGFERHYRGWAVWSDGVGLIARRKTGQGLTGKLLRARDLDGMAELIEAAEQS